MTTAPRWRCPAPPATSPTRRMARRSPPARSATPRRRWRRAGSTPAPRTGAASTATGPTSGSPRRTAACAATPARRSMRTGRPAPAATRSRASPGLRCRSPRGDDVTLRLKLFVLIAGVIIFAMSGVTAVALWREVQRGQELLRREGAALAATAAGEASRWVRADGLEPGGDEALRPVLEGLTRGGQFDRAWVVDRAGKIVACRSLTAAPCPEGPPPSEFAAVDLPLQSLARLVKPASIVATFWIVVGHVLTAIFIRQVTRPLVRLSEAAESLAEERGVRLDPPEDKELADLVRAFNHMSARLEERRAENQRLIAELEARVAQKTREVLRADRLATLGGIAAGFAHEIGNSLNVIRGYGSVASRELPAESPVKSDVEAIRREVTRAAGLIERFLVFARARTVHPHAQPVAPIVREAAEVVGPAAAQANVERTVEIPDGLPEVVADAELLRQAFLNLCVNAIQAMQERGGGRLAVRARREGDAVVVEVADTGPGIDPETRAHVFEPFYTTKANGTGLGLAIVRQAAEAHGGSVEVESALGAGATFRVRLPAAGALEHEAA